MYSGHQEKAIGDQIESSETTMLCLPFSSWTSFEGTLSCSTFFRKSSQEGTTLQGWCCCWRCHCGSIQVPTEARVPIFVQFWVAVILREMQREANMNRPFQSRCHCDYSTNNKHSQLRSTDYRDCCFMAYSPMEKTVWTQNCKKTLEQHVWAYTEWTKGASWGQLLSWGYWSLADGGGSEELSRSREPWQSYDCTTRLWEQNVIYTRAWHKWLSLESRVEPQGEAAIWEHVGSHWRKATNRQIRGRNHKPFLWMIFSGQVEPKWNNVVLGRLTRKHFQVGSEEWNDVLLPRQRIHWIMDFHQDQTLWLAKKRLLKNWRRSQ